MAETCAAAVGSTRATRSAVAVGTLTFVGGAALALFWFSFGVIVLLAAICTAAVHIFEKWR